MSVVRTVMLSNQSRGILMVIAQLEHIAANLWLRGKILEILPASAVNSL